MKKYLSLVVFLALFWVHSAEAATRTFVGDGASHNWSATGAWVEGIVPTAADDVVFSSNTVGSILVIDGTSGSPSLCKSFNTTNYTKTITMGGTAVLAVGGSTSGAFTLTAGMTFAPTSGALIKFVSTTTGNNITMAGYALRNLTFDGVGGGWQFQDANSMAAASTLTLTNGSLDTNSQTQTNAILFSSNNSNTRSLTLGTTNFKLDGTTPGTVWNIATATGMTLSAASSTITLNSGAGTNTQTFAGGGLTYGTVTDTSLALLGNMTITGANTFGALTLSYGGSVPVTSLQGYFLAADQTVTGTFTSAGASLTARNFIASDTVGTARTLSAATFTITNTDLRDITKAGAGSGNISATSSSTGNGDCGGNTGWTFQAPRNVYMKTAVSVNWSAANWFTTSGGSTAATPPLPLCHDTAIFDVNSVTAGSKIITIDMGRIAGSNWTGVANTPQLTFPSSNTMEVYGSLILVSGMTHTGTDQVDFVGRGSLSLDGGTLTWPTSSVININAATGTYTLARAFTSNAGLSVTSGTFALGGFAPNVKAISVVGGAISGSGAITGTTYTQSGGAVTLGGTTTLTGALQVSGGTLDMNSNQITGHTTATISSTGTLNLSGQLNGSGAFSITGGTITDSGASGELKGTTMSFSGGTSAIRKMTASSTFAISSTAALTFNPGVSTWATSWTETGTTHSLTYNGTATNINGTLTVTAASAGSSGYAWSQ